MRITTNRCYLCEDKTADVVASVEQRDGSRMRDGAVYTLVNMESATFRDTAH